MTSFYPSPHTTDTAKYTGPLAIVSYEGPRNSEHQMCGEGKILFANDSTYEGSLQKDMMHGYGVLKGCDGSIYAGEWFEDMRHGLGTFTYSSGSYTGQYERNKKHGMGKESDIAGNVFEGRFEVGDGVHGKMSYANGDIYVGDMKDGDRHGRGKFISCEDGDMREGLWADDVFVEGE